MNKNKSQNKKTLLIILLIAIPTTMLFGFMITNVQDSEDIPIQDGADIPIQARIDIPIDPQGEPKNNWHWHDDVVNDTILMYEIEMIADNKTTEVRDMMLRTSFIFNISISNDTVDFQGDDCYMSQINATERYYNCTPGAEKLECYNQTPWTLAAFQYNDTAPNKPYERYMIGEEFKFPIAMILPINDSVVNDGEIMGDILNESVYGAYYEHGMHEYGIGMVNRWNDISNTTDGNGNCIHFRNTTDGYFADLCYYGNGTLKYGEMYIEMLIPEDENPTEDNLKIVNLTIQRIFDPCSTSRVKWNFTAGDTFYFSSHESGEDECEYIQLKIDIVEIVNNMTDNMAFSLTEEDDAWTCFSHVIANISIWNNNTRRYELDEENETITMANNFFPLVFGEEGGSRVCPMNISKNDLEWFGEFILCFEDSPFDEFNVEENECGILTFKLYMESEELVVIKIDTKTGFLKFFKALGEDWFSFFTTSNKTLIEGKQIIPLENKMVKNMTFTANLTANLAYGNAELIYAILADNPVNESLNSGTPLFYIDIMTTNISKIVGNEITISFTLPSHATFDKISNLYIWYWVVEDCVWWPLLYSEYGFIVREDRSTNTINMTLPVDATPCLMAWSYTLKTAPSGDDDDDDDDDKKVEAIPGYDLYLLMLAISLISIALILEKRKKIRI